MTLQGSLRAAAAVFFALAIPAAANAQSGATPTGPAPHGPLPGPTAPPATHHPTGAARHEGKRTEPLFTLTLTPQLTFPTAADEVIPKGRQTNDEMMLDGSLFVNVAPRVRLFAKYINHADTGGQRINNGRVSAASFNRDAETQEGVAWSFAPDLTFDAAYRERHRTCCPGAGDPTNTQPRFFTGVLGGVTWVFGPRSKIGRPFRAYAEETFYDHHLDAGVKVPKGVVPLGHTTLFKGTITAAFEVFGQQRIVPYFEYQNFSTFFNNQLVPSHTNRTIAGVRIKGTPFVSYTAYMKNDHQYGNPGDLPHTVNLFLEASFKVAGGKAP